MAQNYEERKLLHEHLKHLVKSEYEHIFRIIKRNDEAYTENSNGIFFDILTLMDETILDMMKYIKFCLENRIQEQNRITEMATLTTEVNSLLHSIKST
jgi:Bromodomain extra-terminal - transcription regulation